MSDAVLVELTESVHEEVRLLLEKVSLKTADLLLVAWAKLYEVELVSWDRQLVREANKVVRAYTPKDR
jgi:predicted nucleic acid-binding protein